MIQGLSLHQLANYLQVGAIGADVDIKRISIDTRTLLPDDLYIAIQGERLNGHDYLLEAQKKGASAVIVSEEYKGDKNLTLPMIKVEDTTKALGQIAKYNRRHFQGKMIAITGSNGKTTVKEMIKSICLSSYQEHEVCSTQGNYNNHIGVPLTLLNLNQDHKVAVLELGASEIGDIAYTVRLVMPDIVVLTNASPAHIGKFGSMENIISAKSEIIEGLNKHGLAIINVDGFYADKWLKKAQSVRVMTVGDATQIEHTEYSRSADIKLIKDQFDSLNSRLNMEIESGQEKISINLNYLGHHNAKNAALACAVGLGLNISLESIKAGLESAKPFDSRLQIEHSVKQCRLINDSYNANPESVKSAIDVLSQYNPHTILVLGEMAELGQDSDTYHRQIGQYARQKTIGSLLASGDLNAHAVQAFGDNGYLFDTHEALAKALAKLSDSSSTILVKGSRSAKMEQVIELFIENSRKK